MGRSAGGREAARDAGCPATAALQVLGRKWTGEILWALLDGPRRFTEILARVPGLSDRVLSARLKQLERTGIVTRRQFAEIPPRVEYALTARGRDLAPVLEAMTRWSRRWAVRPAT
ncbi:MAG TPA: helix-turn-helix domain-containing protein [Actinomycetota bacterium]|nr:helix-turn-helix domain-containing protein [Actinomycetota bacterium]